MKRFTSRQIALCGIAAGLYAAITVLTAPFAYGGIQFRIADSLCVLAALQPELTVGLTLGCLIANLFSTVSALDIILGTAATLLGCLLTRGITKPLLAPLPTVLSNACLVGAMLAWLYLPAEMFWKGFALYGAQVAAGELAVGYLLGLPLYIYMRKSALLERLIRRDPPEKPR